jgi:hypothetical protein
MVLWKPEISEFKNVITNEPENFVSLISFKSLFSVFTNSFYISKIRSLLKNKNKIEDLLLKSIIKKYFLSEILIK